MELRDACALFGLCGMEGLDRRALREKYKRLALRCHPDKARQGAAAPPAEFHRVQAAYAALDQALKAREAGGTPRDRALGAPTSLQALVAWMVLAVRGVYPARVTLDVVVRLPDLLEGDRFHKLVYKSRRRRDLWSPVEVRTRVLVLPLDVYRERAVFEAEGDVGVTGVAGGLCVRTRIVDVEGAAVTQAGSPCPGDLFHVRHVTLDEVLGGEPLRFRVPLSSGRSVEVAKRFHPAAAWDDSQTHQLVAGEGFTVEGPDGGVRRGDLHVKYVLALGAGVGGTPPDLGEIPPHLPTPWGLSPQPPLLRSIGWLAPPC